MRFKVILTATVLSTFNWAPSARAEKPVAPKLHQTICEYYKCKPEQAEIKITAWSDFAKFTPKKDYGKKEVETIRKHLSEYVIITEDERKWLSNHLSMAASGPREGTIQFPKWGFSYTWSDANFLILYVGDPRKCDQATTTILAHRSSLDLLPKVTEK